MSTQTIEQQAHEYFTRDTAEHKMTVVKDDGLYRHLKFMGVGSSNGWFELVTWPGVLCIHGDHGTYTFARIDDMFGFFRSSESINPVYWAEKCISHDRHSPPREFDSHAFSSSVRGYVDEWIADEGLSEEAAVDLRRSVTDEVLSEGEYREMALPAVSEFEWEWPRYAVRPEHRLRIGHLNDEPGLGDDYNIHFLWCLYAIRWGIRVYDAVKAGRDASEVTVACPSWAMRPSPETSPEWVEASVRPVVDVAVAS